MVTFPGPFRDHFRLRLRPVLGHLSGSLAGAPRPETSMIRSSRTLLGRLFEVFVRTLFSASFFGRVFDRRWVPLAHPRAEK